MKPSSVKGVPQGFTLLEVLIAMTITAMVAVMAYGGLSAAASMAEHQRAQVARLEAIATAIGWLGSDLRQSMPRAISAGHGERAPALQGGGHSDELLELTRAGWTNWRGTPRGNLQRVRYRLDAQGVLWRDHWLVLDRLAENDSIQSVELLPEVRALEISFLDPDTPGAARSSLGGEWSDQWPAPGARRALPLAVRIRLELTDIGAVERIIGLPDA